MTQNWTLKKQFSPIFTLSILSNLSNFFILVYIARLRLLKLLILISAKIRGLEFCWVTWPPFFKEVLETRKKLVLAHRSHGKPNDEFSVTFKTYLDLKNTGELPQATMFHIQFYFSTLIGKIEDVFKCHKKLKIFEFDKMEDKLDKMYKIKRYVKKLLLIIFF